MSAAHLALLFDAVKKAKECPLDENREFFYAATEN